MKTLKAVILFSFLEATCLAQVQLAALSLSPTGDTGVTQTFNAVYSDPNGASDLGVVYLDFGVSAPRSYSCFIAYVPPNNTIGAVGTPTGPLGHAPNQFHLGTTNVHVHGL